MSVRPTDILTPPIGMATSYAPVSIPRTHARLLEGFNPARHGKLNLTPLIKQIARNYGITIHGTAIWLSSDGQLDKFLIFSGTTVYTVPLFSTYAYDERQDGQHSYIQLAASLTNLGVTLGSNASNGVVSMQVRTQLIVSVGGLLYRYYCTEPGNVQNFLTLGLATPGIPSLGSQTTGGSLTLLATYSYLTTMVDEFGNESSPSPSASITLTGSNNKLTVTRGSGTTGGTTGIVSWKIYRLNPGSTTYNFVATVAIGTTTYVDGNSDAVVNAGASAPTSGENDVPNSANIMAEWQGRVVLNDLVNPNQIQVSNANSISQFSSFTLPTAAADGLRVKVGGRGQGQVTGLANLGSYLAVFTRETPFLLMGDDSTQFVLRQVQSSQGCQNPYTVQAVVGGRVLYLSNDGLYMLDGNFSPAKISEEVDDLFRGFKDVAQVGEPTAAGRPASIQVSDAIFNNARSFVADNRYYLSIGNKTLCYDLLSGGWGDTKWGYVKTASRYLSQHTLLTGSAPETVFLTFGDINTFDTHLSYFTVADTPQDIDAPSVVNSRIVFRPVDISGQMQVSLKRIALVSIFGKTSSDRGTQIGTIRFWTDDYLAGEAPILAGIAFRRKGALSEIAGPSASGEIVWLEMSFTVNDIELGNVLAELVPLN